MKALAGIIFSFILLASCAINSAERNAAEMRFQRTIPICEGAKDCEFKWSMARRWILDNAGFKLQNYNADYMETFNVQDLASTKLWARVTKEPIDGERYRILIEVGCNNMFGCGISLMEAKNNFNNVVNTQLPDAQP